MNYTEEQIFQNMRDTINSLAKTQLMQTNLLEDVCNSLVELNQRVVSQANKIKKLETEVEKWHSSILSSQPSKDDQQN